MYVRFVVLSLTFLMSIVVANAQPLTARPDQGMSGNGGFQAGQVDAINLQNGALTAQIPLASLPPIAGGKLSYTLTASYNSKIWEAKSIENVGLDQNLQCFAQSTREISMVWNSGWRIGGQYEIFFRDANDDYDYTYPTGEQCWGVEYYHMAGSFFKPMLRTPDGAEHELRIEGSYPTYPGERLHLKNYYKLQSGIPGNPTFDSPIRLYTVDGTFLTVVYNPPSSTVRWTLYNSDGTRVETRADGQRIIDTNGNSIHFGSNETDGAFVKDEHTGRMIKWNSATYEGQPASRIQYQSVGGTWQSVYVVMGQTTVQGKVYGKTGWRQGSEPGSGLIECIYQAPVPNQTINVIRKIVYPANSAANTVAASAFGKTYQTTSRSNPHTT